MKDVIVVTSGKGGVGKSTISAMIGLNLSSRGRILLIDADLGLNNLDLLLNVPSSSYDIADVIKGRCELEEAMMKVKENLFILNLCLSSEVRKYPEYLLETIIGQTGDYFDYIIIDSPAGMEQGFLNTLSVATRGIIVLNDELTSYEDGRKIQRLCKIHNLKNILYVMNRYNKKESIKEYIRTRFRYYLNDNHLIYINNVAGNLYRKYRLLSHDKEFNNLIKKIVKPNSVRVF